MPEPKWIGLLHLITVVAGRDVELVAGPDSNAGKEPFPNSARIASLQYPVAGSPIIEIANEAYLLGRGRPDGEIRAGYAVDRHRMRAELFVEAVVAAFVEEVEIVWSKQRCARLRCR